MPWKTFLAAQWDGQAAADFFTVEVLTVAGLVRYVVLFVMKLKTRTVEIAGITRQPDGSWMNQVARNLTNADDGFLRGMDYLILDRDPLYTACGSPKERPHVVGAIDGDTDRSETGVLDPRPIGIRTRNV